jgi:hypothetical protein
VALLRRLPVGPLEQTSITITTNRLQNVATQAARWGADQELEACCEWLDTEKILTKDGGYIRKLRDARRPKPPSLKEQALEALQFVDEKLDLPLHNHCNAIHTIRRALEALDD